MVEEISECFLQGGVTIEKEDLFDPVYPKNIIRYFNYRRYNK